MKKILFYPFLSGFKRLQSKSAHRTFNIFPNKKLFPMAFSEYKTFLDDNKVLNTKESLEIKDIGQ